MRASGRNNNYIREKEEMFFLTNYEHFSENTPNDYLSEEIREISKGWSDTSGSFNKVRLQSVSAAPVDSYHVPIADIVVSKRSSRMKFERLKSDWKRESLMLSSPIEMAMLESYQKIIGMGKDALPFIFEELSREPDHWFWALNSIIGEDPVPDNLKGNVKEMTRIWLDWAIEKGFLDG